MQGLGKGVYVQNKKVGLCILDGYFFGVVVVKYIIGKSGG